MEMWVEEILTTNRMMIPPAQQVRVELSEFARTGLKMPQVRAKR
jgi:hypothetical protein